MYVIFTVDVGFVTVYSLILLSEKINFFDIMNTTLMDEIIYGSERKCFKVWIQRDIHE